MHSLDADAHDPHTERVGEPTGLLSELWWVESPGDNDVHHHIFKLINNLATVQRQRQYLAFRFAEQNKLMFFSNHSPNCISHNIRQPNIIINVLR